MQIIQLEFNLFKVTMKIIVLLCSIFLCANSFAYSPNLQEIDPAETGNDFVDTKSIKKLGVIVKSGVWHSGRFLC